MSTTRNEERPLDAATDERRGTTEERNPCHRLRFQECPSGCDVKLFGTSLNGSSKRPQQITRMNCHRTTLLRPPTRRPTFEISKMARPSPSTVINIKTKKCASNRAPSHNIVHSNQVVSLPTYAIHESDHHSIERQGSD